MTEAANRQSRYLRKPKEVSLTPQKWRLLKAIAECRVISSQQLARMLKLGEKTTRYHLRQLFDGGLVDVVPVSRMSLLDPAEAIDHGSLFGSAPNVYTPTKDGLKILTDAGLLDSGKTEVYKYTLKNSMYLAHELMVRDVYVWAKGLAGCTVERFDTGKACAVELPHKRQLLPDALIIVQDPKGVTVAFVEADRGTERGSNRWEEKYRGYLHLMANEELMVQTIGYKRARVIVTVPNEARALWLKSLIESLMQKHKILPKRYYIAVEGALVDADMSSPIWHVPWLEGLQPMI